MTSVLVRKLAHAGFLSEADQKRLLQVIRSPYERGPREDIIQHGDAPQQVHLVLKGVACRYKLLPDGGRSIMALLLPGDFCDLHVSILGRMDHSIGTLTRCQLVDIPRQTIEELLDNYPRIGRALWWATLVDEAVLREWLVNMGRRQADRQMAHLICEVQLRLKAVGMAEDFYLPLTQKQLADTLGITTVHAQRVLSDLQNQGLIKVQNRRVVIENLDALRAFGEFDPDYLHLLGDNA